MRLLLDQGLPRSAAAILRGEGLDVVHVSEVGLAAATDLDILANARESGRVVVTLDADFHALLMVDRQTAPSVIRLRLERLKGERLAELLRSLLDTLSVPLEQGALVTVTPQAVRVHRLR